MWLVKAAVVVEPVRILPMITSVHVIRASLVETVNVSFFFIHFKYQK